MEALAHEKYEKLVLSCTPLPYEGGQGRMVVSCGTVDSLKPGRLELVMRELPSAEYWTEFEVI